MSVSKEQNEPAAPWWRFPIVWMVIGGPLVVVVAGVVTAVIAYTHVDPVMDVKTVTKNPGHAPALQGRNKAAEVAVQPAER
jgi:uncharacterized protein